MTGTCVPVAVLPCLALTVSVVCSCRCCAAVICLQEPRQSPSHGTTTTGSMVFDLPHPLADEAAAAALPGPSSTSNQGQDEQEEAPLQLTCSQLTAPDALAPGAAAGTHGTGSTTPGDGLGLLLHAGPDLEETTTPELEQIGIVPSQEGGSQHQLLGSGPGAAVAAAAAAGGGSGSRVHAASTGRGRGSAAGGVPGGSGGRGARRPGVVCEEVTAKQMLFPVFRPLKERKCVILVRHGESSEWRLLPGACVHKAPLRVCVHLTNLHRVACEGTRLLVQLPGIDVAHKSCLHSDPCWPSCSCVLLLQPTTSRTRTARAGQTPRSLMHH